MEKRGAAEQNEDLERKVAERIVWRRGRQTVWDENLRKKLREETKNLQRKRAEQGSSRMATAAAAAAAVAAPISSACSPGSCSRSAAFPETSLRSSPFSAVSSLPSFSLSVSRASGRLASNWSRAWCQLSSRSDAPCRFGRSGIILCIY